MIELMAAAMAGAALGQFHYFNGETDALRPVATRASYPAAMVDDVRRPGFNGRLFITRPGWREGPWAVAEGEPGASYYGAFDQQGAMAYARVGHTVIGISPWERLEGEGLRHIEASRAFWLKEQGFTGGVRTFVNDAVTWKTPEAAPPADAPAPSVDAGDAVKPVGGKIEPRATIQVPADLPRAKRRIRVEAPALQAPLAAHPGGGPVHISLPRTAPAGLARQAARVEGGAPVRVAAR